MIPLLRCLQPIVPPEYNSPGSLQTAGASFRLAMVGQVVITLMQRVASRMAGVSPEAGVRVFHREMGLLPRWVRDRPLIRPG